MRSGRSCPCGFRSGGSSGIACASPHGKQFGSTINAPAYQRGDFDNDGRRDVPEYPK